MIRGGMVTLAVKDVAASVRFYIETLGLKLVEETGEASVLDAGEGFLIELRAGIPGNHPPVTLFPKVPLAEAIAIYEMRGVAFADDGAFEDPDGNRLRLRARP
jgi:catechol 2,3-dioxygenase-like lactoylglutathione lyase family enzyme